MFFGFQYFAKMIIQYEFHAVWCSHPPSIQSNADFGCLNKKALNSWNIDSVFIITKYLWGTLAFSMFVAANCSKAASLSEFEEIKLFKNFVVSLRTSKLHTMATRNRVLIWSSREYDHLRAEQQGFVGLHLRPNHDHHQVLQYPADSPIETGFAEKGRYWRLSLFIYAVEIDIDIDIFLEVET